MTLDKTLLNILVCPLCKGPLEFVENQINAEGNSVDELICSADQLAFPVRDDIPVLLEHEARSLRQEPQAENIGQS